MADVGWISFHRFPFPPGSQFAYIFLKLDAAKLLGSGPWNVDGSGIFHSQA